jgi:acetyl esterase/lipase
MPFDPYLLQQLEVLRGLPPFDPRDGGMMDPEVGARFAAFTRDPAPWQFPDAVATVDATVDGPHGPIPVRIYRPAGDSDAAGRAALLWLHGGAFVAGSIDMNEGHMVSAELAARAGAVVVSVNYRLAVGGVKYPVPLDDVVASWNWLVASSAQLGLDLARLSIGGASAGGNLATAAAMRVRDEGGSLPASMLLAYPLVHYPVPPLDFDVLAEMTVLPEILRFAPDFHEWAMLKHLGRISNAPAGVAPGNFDLHRMPAAFIAPAEYDDLRPSAELFARQLIESGVPVEVQLAEGMVHGHLDRTPSLPAVDRTLDFFAEALRR